MRFRSLILAVGLLAVGCNATPKAPASAPLAAAGSTMAKIDVHAQDILDAATRTAPSDARVDIVAHAGSIRTLTVEGAAQLEKDRANESLMAGHEAEQDTKLALRDQTIDRLNTQFWSPRQVRLAWLIAGVIVGGWALLGASAVILPLIGGISGMAWSVRIIRLLPFANIFSIFRDRALGADVAASLASAVKLRAATKAGL